MCLHPWKGNEVTDVTLLVKACDRHNCVLRLLKSIRQFYPGVPVIVLDDGETDPGDAVYEHDVQYCFNQGADYGLSKGRNMLVDLADTRFVVILDDDFVFTRKTNLEALRHFVAGGIFDLAGGAVREQGGVKHFEGMLEMKGTTLHRTHVKLCAPGFVDAVPNFFLAERAVLQKLRWNEQLKLGEHQAFFLDAKAAGAKVGFLPDVEIYHDRLRPAVYIERKTRAFHYFNLFMKLYGIENVTGSLSS